MYGVTLTLPWRGSCLNPSNSHRKVQANAVSYSSALSACQKSSEWPRALWPLQSMTDQLLGCSISWIELPHQTEEVCSILKSNSATWMRQISPTLIALSSSISACEKGGEWQRALILFTSAQMVPSLVWKMIDTVEVWFWLLYWNCMVANGSWKVTRLNSDMLWLSLNSHMQVAPWLPVFYTLLPVMT